MDVNELGEELSEFVIASNGIEVYRVKTDVALRWAPELERAWKPKDLVKAERALRGMTTNTYAYAASELIKKYDWIEGFPSVEKDLQILTDHPVLDLKNRIIRDVDRAEKRLIDLREIKAFVNQVFREAKSLMMDLEFYLKVVNPKLRSET